MRGVFYVRVLMCAAAAMIGVGSARGQVSVIVPESGEGVAAPACGFGDTYFADVATSPWTLTLPDETSPAGFFSPGDMETIAADLPVDINGRTGTVDWIVARGLLVEPGQVGLDVGLVMAEVTMDDVGAGVEVFRVVSVIDEESAAEAIASVRSSQYIEIVPAGGGATTALGSSCSCPTCPLGGRFWVPFFVIGVGNVPGGQTCCGTACATACASLEAGKSMQEAWLAGQGTWVTCMLCQL